jgi:hypothetical protein
MFFGNPIGSRADETVRRTPGRSPVVTVLDVAVGLGAHRKRGCQGRSLMGWNTINRLRARRQAIRPRNQ